MEIISNIKCLKGDLEQGMGQFFSKVDMFAGYWKILLADQLQELTIFTCEKGQFSLQCRTSAL